MANTNDRRLQIQPGVARGPTQSSIPNAWWETNLIRWKNGVMAPFGGWEPLVLSAAVASPIRAIHRWTDAAGITRLGILCEANVYVVESATLRDVTPAGGMTSPSSVATVGGFGDGPFGKGTFGTPRPPVVRSKSDSPWWSIGSWGETLLVMSSYDGRLLQWNPSTPATPCTAVAGAPTGNRGFVVTQQKTVVMFGIGGVFNRWGWCSLDNILDWTFNSVSNTAGFYDMEPASPFQGALATKYGIVFSTREGTYFATYTGLPNIYSWNIIAGGVIPVNSQSIVEFQGRAMWYSSGSFWTTDGVSAKPVDCPLYEWLTDVSNPRAIFYRMWGMNYGMYPELIWFFPSLNSDECDRYIKYNFKDDIWDMGQLARSAGCPATLVDTPTLASTTTVYRHESGKAYAGATVLPFATSTKLVFGDMADSVVSVNKIITDQGEGENPGGCDYIMTGRFNRGTQNVQVTKKGFWRGDGKVDIRITARDLYLTIQNNSAVAEDWTFGSASISVTNRGRR